MLKSLKTLALGGALLTANATWTQAQPAFSAPAAQEFTYGSPSVIRPMNVSNYSIQLSGLDVYLSGWGLPLNGVPSEFIWQYTAIGNPTAIAGQGSFAYTGIADLGTGIIYNSATGRFNYLVVYYKLGVGHFLDIYEVPVPIVPTAAPVLISSVQLSNSTNYGRIRMDSYSQYAAAIVWEYPGVGIQTQACHNGTWGNVLTLSGTANATGPDIALLPRNGTVYVNYAYYDAGAGTITESTIDRNVLLSSTGTVSPLVEDVYAAGTIASHIVLDCPDYNNNTPNWAYTFTDGQKVMVRYRDYATSLFANTVCVNDGATFGNQSTMPWYEAYSPSLHYGSSSFGGSTGQITVAWYASDNMATHGYIAMEMSADGTTLLSAPDYMALPNAFTPNKYPFFNIWYRNTTGIALSKTSDFNFSPGFLYASYFDYNNVTGNYQLHHAFHQWNNPVFKGGAPAAGIEKSVAAASVATYPNPFRDDMTATVTLPGSGALDLQLFDMTGHKVWQYQATLDKGTHQVKIGEVSSLAPGIYLLNSSFNNKKIGAQMVTKQ